MALTNSFGWVTDPPPSGAGGPIGGAILANQIAVGTGVNTIGGSADFTRSGAGVINHNGSIINNGSVSWQGSQKIKRTVSAAGNYVVLSTDYLIGKTGITVGGDTVTLPDPAAAGVGTGTFYIIKDETGGSAVDNITVNATAGNVDGAANFIINTNFGSASFYTDGANWFVV